MSIPEWGGRRVQQARAVMAQRLPAPCARGCGTVVTAETPWVIGHIKSRHAHPELTWQMSNWQIECRACSDASTSEAIAEKALLGAGFSPSGARQEAAALPFSLPEVAAKEDPFTIPESMSWSAFCLLAPEWLKPYLEPDENSSPPLAVSPLHPAAVGTYADVAIPWIEKVEGKQLRWWQLLSLALKLQHDDAGRLLKRTVYETAPRRAGKSVGLRGLALWRMAHGMDLFGERQEIIHTGSDMSVCRKAQKEAWRWSEANEWTVTRGNGKEAIERPDDGSVWYVRAQDATYGWDTTLALVDEGWDVKPDTVSEGIEPSLMGRQSPQMVMTSTSHRRARSTMRTALATALAGDDPKILVLWWGAPTGADPSDPEVWQAASPYWDEDRHEFVAAMYAKALAGEQDPELDDPDPMKGFECQFLNRWNLKERRQVGEPLVTADDWLALTARFPEAGTVPAAVAVESWPGAGVSVVAAWQFEDGRTLVSASSHDDVADAAAAAKALGCRMPLLVGASLVSDPAFKGMRLKAQTGSVVAAVSDLARWLNEGVLVHDGGEHLGTQATGLRIKASATGLRVVSAGPADALKAAAWAAASARANSAKRPVRVLVAKSA